MNRCLVCANLISRERAAIARSRGVDPLYCSERCKNTAAVRRARAKKKQLTAGVPAEGNV